ncbi:MAG: hypothetical protein ACJ8CB_29665 [Ktedonobacteraceae bacterium]
MNIWDLQHCIDLHRTDIDLEEFSAALTLQHVSRLIASGGSDVQRPDLDLPLNPRHLGAFLSRAIEMARRTKRFEREWERLYRLIPLLELAWEKGQALFQSDLTRAMADEGEMEYLSEVDFAVDCFAQAAARNTYPHDPTLQAWVTSGYMLAWRRHFLADEDITS